MLIAIFIFVVCGIGIYSLLQAIKKAPLLDMDEHGFLEFMKPKFYRHKNQKS